MEVALSAYVSDALELTGERLTLLQGKLGNLLDWQVPQLKQTVGPFDPAAFNEYDERRKKLIDACVEQLRSYTDNEIDEIVQSLKKGDEDSHGWRKFSDKEIYYFRDRPLRWYVGGFGHPDHVADFDYWTKMPHFSVLELTCLTIGINPSEFEKRDLDKLISSSDRPKFFHALQFLLLRYEQLWRTFGSSGSHPLSFVTWAKKVEFVSHPAFIEPLRRYHVTPKPADGAVSPKKQDQREENDGEAYNRKEFSYQSFYRTFHLPKDVVDGDKIQAKYENGILQLSIPKREEAKQKPSRLIDIS